MKFEGGDALVRTLRELSTRASRDVLRRALLEVGEPMRQEIASRAPREPGAPDLADNIQLAPTRVGETGDVSVGIGVPKRFFYDWFLEHGTVDRGAQPFYRPTIDGGFQRAITQLRNTVWAELSKKGIGGGFSTSSPLV